MNLVKNVRLHDEHMNTPANNGRKNISSLIVSKRTGTHLFPYITELYQGTGTKF